MLAMDYVCILWASGSKPICFILCNGFFCLQYNLESTRANLENIYITGRKIIYLENNGYMLKSKMKNFCMYQDYAKKKYIW